MSQSAQSIAVVTAAACLLVALVSWCLVYGSRLDLGRRSPYART